MSLTFEEAEIVSAALSPRSLVLDIFFIKDPHFPDLELLAVRPTEASSMTAALLVRRPTADPKPSNLPALGGRRVELDEADKPGVEAAEWGIEVGERS